MSDTFEALRAQGEVNCIVGETLGEEHRKRGFPLEASLRNRRSRRPVCIGGLPYPPNRLHRVGPTLERTRLVQPV